MKRLGILLLILISNVMFAQDLQEYRKLLQTGEKSERAAKTLIDKSNTAYQTTKEPIFAGFLAVGKFFMAKHAFNPLKKMSYFNDGKKTMDQALKMDPSNLEIRLMRLITQESAPSFLGYNHQIKEDRTYLTREYVNEEDKFLKSYIKDYLKL